jgi:hypothetical protein
MDGAGLVVRGEIKFQIGPGDESYIVFRELRNDKLHVLNIKEVISIQKA